MLSQDEVKIPLYSRLGGGIHSCPIDTGTDILYALTFTHSFRPNIFSSYTYHTYTTRVLYIGFIQGDKMIPQNSPEEIGFSRKRSAHLGMLFPAVIETG
jgi:hypothetical protein